MLAWANLVHAHRTLRQWVVYALLLVVFAGILFLTFDDDATFGARLFEDDLVMEKGQMDLEGGGDNKVAAVHVEETK